MDLYKEKALETLKWKYQREKKLVRKKADLNEIWDWLSLTSQEELLRIALIQRNANELMNQLRDYQKSNLLENISFFVLAGVLEENPEMLRETLKRMSQVRKQVLFSGISEESSDLNGAYRIFRIADRELKEQLIQEYPAMIKTCLELNGNEFLRIVEEMSRQNEGVGAFIQYHMRQLPVELLAKVMEWAESEMATMVLQCMEAEDALAVCQKVAGAKQCDVLEKSSFLALRRGTTKPFSIENLPEEEMVKFFERAMFYEVDLIGQLTKESLVKLYGMLETSGKQKLLRNASELRTEQLYCSLPLDMRLDMLKLMCETLKEPSKQIVNPLPILTKLKESGVKLDFYEELVLNNLA